MTELKNYLLTLDLDKFRTQISAISGTYTDFGEQLRVSIQGTTDSFEALKSKTSETANELDRMGAKIGSFSEGIKSAVDTSSKGIDLIANYSSTVVRQLSALSAKGLGAKPSNDAKKSMQQLSEYRNAYSSINKLATGAQQQNTKAQRVAKQSLDTVKKGADQIKKGIKSEVSAAKSKLSGILNNVPGGIFGRGIIGGLIGAMVLGYTERDRLKFWSGEILNVFEASGESLSSKSLKHATDWFADFQNTAENLMGIPREGIRATLKTMVDAGYRSKDIMQTFDKSLGLVGKNLGVATIALDKHFNQQTGTSIQNITKITQEVGGSLEDVTHDYTLLGFAAQRSGMGISKFTDAVMAGASGMRQYGVEMHSVANTMATIQKHYQRMGLSSQYAGGQAQQVVQGLTTGLTGMDPSVKAMLAQKLFPEYSALDAMQKWEDGFKRVAAGEDDEFMSKVYGELYQWAVGDGRDRSTAIRIMEYAGLDNRTAATVHDLKGEVASSNALKKLSHAERKKLRKAFQTESEQLSDLQKLQFNLKQAIAQVGNGLIKLLVSLVGSIAVLVKGIPALLTNMHDQVKLSQVATTMENYMNNLNTHAASGINDIMVGSKMAAKALGEEFLDNSEFKPLIDVLKWEAPKGDVEKFLTDAVAMFAGEKTEEARWKRAHMHQTGMNLETQMTDQGLMYVNPFTGKTHATAEAAARESLRYYHSVSHYIKQIKNIDAMVKIGTITEEQGEAKKAAFKDDKSNWRFRAYQRHRASTLKQRMSDVKAAYEAQGYKIIITKEEVGTAQDKAKEHKQLPMGSM